MKRQILCSGDFGGFGGGGGGGAPMPSSASSQAQGAINITNADGSINPLGVALFGLVVAGFFVAVLVVVSLFRRN
jgi:hypothetical protein